MGAIRCTIIMAAVLFEITVKLQCVCNNMDIPGFVSSCTFMLMHEHFSNICSFFDHIAFMGSLGLVWRTQKEKQNQTPKQVSIYLMK